MNKGIIPSGDSMDLIKVSMNEYILDENKLTQLAERTDGPGSEEALLYLMNAMAQHGKRENIRQLLVSNGNYDADTYAEINIRRDDARRIAKQLGLTQEDDPRFFETAVIFLNNCPEGSQARVLVGIPGFKNGFWYLDLGDGLGVQLFRGPEDLDLKQMDLVYVKYEDLQDHISGTITKFDDSEIQND